MADEVFEGLGWLSAMDAPTINNHAGIDFVLLILSAPIARAAM